MENVVAVNPEFLTTFRVFLESGRVLLLEAPCGFGKTTLAQKMLQGVRLRVLQSQAKELDFEKLEKTDQWDILFLEDLQQLTSEEESQKLCLLIRNHPDKRFVLTSRGEIPGYLIPFRIAGLLIEVNETDLFFTKKTVSEYFQSCGLRLSETELNAIMKLTMGYPLAIRLFANRLTQGEAYHQRLGQEVQYDLFRYYDEMVFCRFDLRIRRFLLELAPFEYLNTELAKMASGDPDAGKMLLKLQKDSRMIQCSNAECFSFWPIYRKFLLWEQERLYTPEQQRALYSRGGLYYELHKEYAKALDFYSKSGEQNKVSELIIKIMGQHPGMGYYEELEPYFLSLPDEVIEASPALMQGKSMLCALRADYEGSERWYCALREFANLRSRSDAAAKEAKSRLAWLDISLPQRGATGLIDTIKSAFRLAVSKEIKTLPFSVTSTLPSIMNGGKDFSDWSRQDDFLYAAMRLPVEGILGKDGVGLADCAIAESKFEKGENISDRMLSLVSRLSDIQTKGTPDIEFALIGLLVRSQVDMGKASDAAHTLQTLRGRFAEHDQDRFLPNIDAMLCRIALRNNDWDLIDEWYRDKAPRDALYMMVMKRYQYLTEAMVELALGDNDAALLTLSPLSVYFQRCARRIDEIHLQLLTAIAKFRKKEDGWVAALTQGLSTAEAYGFVRTVSVYGAALLPLLEKTMPAKASPFFNQVTQATRRQAIFYPDFLKPQSQLVEQLTETELQVLRLLCAEKSNAEIGELLHIRLATVKSHTSHIFQKLGVSRRSEAKATAKRLHIISS